MHSLGGIGYHAKCDAVVTPTRWVNPAYHLLRPQRSTGRKDSFGTGCDPLVKSTGFVQLDTSAIHELISCSGYRFKSIYLFVHVQLPTEKQP
jgi:hypothetical protein